MAKPPKNTIKWHWHLFKNWVYDKWMRARGFKPYGLDLKNDRYTYMRVEEIEEFVREAEEEEPEYEEILYKRLPGEWWREDGKENDATAKMAVAKALREGKDDARIIRRSLP